jgi:hypothetical protein
MGDINVRNKASVKSFVGVYNVEVNVKSHRCGRILVGRREPVGLEKPFRRGDLGGADVRSASSAMQGIRVNIGLTRAVLTFGERCHVCGERRRQGKPPITR